MRMSHREVALGRAVPGNVVHGLVRLGLEITHLRRVRECRGALVALPAHGLARLGLETTHLRQVRGCHGALVALPAHDQALPAVVLHDRVAEGQTQA